MHFFDYPYGMIIILVAVFLLVGLAGLHFTLKAIQASKGPASKRFCGVAKLENAFHKASETVKTRSVVFFSVSLDSMKRLYPESKSIRLYEQIQNILLNHFGAHPGGEISLYGDTSFVAINNLNDQEITQSINDCFAIIGEILVDHGAVGVVRLHCGYYTTCSNEISFDTALSRAKQACSIAEDKAVPYWLWDSTTSKEFERKIHIENNIHHEIENNRFYLEYQPIWDTATNTVIGAEVLSRLNSVTEGVLSPYYFLSAVSNVGLNRKFDYYIFEKNCKWIASDLKTRRKYMYTINFSRYTLCDENMADHVIRIIEKYGIDYSNIAVEILEDKDLNTAETAMVIKNLRRLNEKGISFLLDDFGTGYANFSNLAEFDICIVKIDITLTQNATNPAGFLILRNIINTAHDLGYRALCEGIETEEHKNAAIAAGCDLMQGYYFNQPMPVAEFETLFSAL